MILNFEQNKIEKIEEYVFSLNDFTRLESLELCLNNNLLKKLPPFSASNKNRNVINEIILNFELKKIENMEDFVLSLRVFFRLENLTLNLNNNLLTKLPTFSINNNYNNNRNSVINKNDTEF